MPKRLWAFDDNPDIEDQPPHFATSLTSLGFIRAALRRSKWLWRGLALAGLLAGLGFFLKLPPVYQASTSLLLTPMGTGGEDAGAPITNEQTIAQSRTVAALAMKKLGMTENVNSFVASYTVTATTDRVLLITVNAPSGDTAVTRAKAVAAAFLQFRATLLQTQQQLLISSLNQQISQARQNLRSITARIHQVSAETGSSGQQSTLSSLEKEQTQATAALAALEQTVNGTKANTLVNTDTIVQGSQVLDKASPLPPHSRLKRMVEYAAIGLIAGLALGLAIVVIRAIVSDRLRRRDDVAQALGAPVKLSVGDMRLNHRQGLEAARGDEVRRIATFLGKVVPPGDRGPASLAVVPADDAYVAAVCLASLAVARAREGLHVVVADLCDGAPAARLLGVTDAGVRPVSVDGIQLVVVVPDQHDVMPTGPLGRSPGQGGAGDPLAAVCDSADLLLTLAPLDPSLGGEHLAGWTRAVVVTVTAGQSSAARINAVGEMVRLAGLPLISGVLIGADKTDESLGVPPAAQEADRDAVGGLGLNHADDRFFVGVEEGSAGRPSSDR